MFPYEYRSWAKLKEIIVNKPVGFDFSANTFRQLRTRSTGTLAAQTLRKITPYSSSPTELKFRTDSFYTDLGGTILLSDDGFHGNYSASLTPNCLAVDGLNHINYSFVYEKLGYLGSGYDTIHSTNRSDVINYNRPDLQFIVTNDFVYPEKDTVSWEVRIANTDPSATASNVWVGALGDANLEIVDVRDKTTNVSLNTNMDVFKLGSLGPNGFQDLVIYAKFTSCSPDSLLLRVGYDCSAYPDSITDYQCSYFTKTLKYEPINTRLDVSIIDQQTSVDLCTKERYELQINNTGSPKVFDSYLDLELRQGLTLSDTAWLYIDGRVDSILINGFTDLGSNIYRWNFANRDALLDQNGLEGVKSANGYKMKLVFWLTTDCDFTSSSSFLVRPGGYLKCGKAVNAPYVLTEPIQIKNVLKPYFSAIDFHMNPIDACSYYDSTYAKFINLGPNKTGTTDRFILSLPLGLRVDTSYIDTSRNAPLSAPEWDTTNGQNLYSWKIPSGIEAGDSCVFQLKTYLNNGLLSCGLKQFYAQAVVTSPAYCVSSATYCDIDVATSTIQLEDSVIKETYLLDFKRALSLPNGINEEILLNYSIENTGSDKISGSALIVQVIYDSNANGIVDLGEEVLSHDTIFDAINRGSSLVRNIDFDVLSSKTCNLLLYISQANCVCDRVTEPIDYIQLLNAGRDTIICPNDILAIGFAGNSNNSYSWNNASLLTHADSSIATYTAPSTGTSRDTSTMILTTNKGTCSSADTMQIITYIPINLAMSDSVDLCYGSSIRIGNVATDGESKFKTSQWLPADSLSNVVGFITTANPTQNTMYQLRVTDAAGCTVMDSTFIQIQENPIAAFTMLDSCAETLFTFTNTSDYKGNQADSVHWDMDYLGVSQFNTISYTIDSALILPVHLYVSNEYNCWDTITQQLEVFPLPSPATIYHPACQGSMAQLESSSTISSGTLSYSWEIDGLTYTGDQVQFPLPFTDSIVYSLTSISDKGCTRTVSATSHTLNKPDIGLSLADRCIEDSVYYEIIKYAGTQDSLTSYLWNLGDGSISTLSKFRHIYSDTGTFAVQVISKNIHNCSDTASAVVTLFPQPISDFVVNNICHGDSITVRDASTLSKGTSSIYWNTGLGYQLGDSALGWLPSSAGTFSLEQKIISDKGCQDSSSQKYTVHYTENIGQSVQGKCENTYILFNANNYQVDSVASHRWLINGDTIRAANASYRFPKDSTYIINQRITTHHGCETDTTFSITINPAPEADILITKPCEDNLVSIATSTALQEYRWSLEDGNTNINQEFDHTFLAPDTYTIWLQVTNEFSCSSNAEDSVTITNVVNPDFEIGNLCEGESQWVVQKSFGLSTPITSSTFDMDNGDIITEKDSFEYKYQMEGTYSVNLEITTLPNCDYSITKPIIIYPLPVADFTLSPDHPDIFTPEVIGNNVSDIADSIVYRLSDGTVYSSFNFSHKFTDSGYYDIEQWVRTEYGCVDSTSRQLYIHFGYKVYIPNSFTPNGDDLNAGFKPIGLGLKNYELEIYNRWGERVFRSTPDLPYWTGAGSTPGYYLYRIRAVNFKDDVYYYSGAVYLLR